VRPSKTHPEGSVATQSGHCRINRSKKDHLYKDDIAEMAKRHFGGLSGPPAAKDLGFRNRGNKYDELIRGWTQYWNDVLQPNDPLDPDLVKALIASESSFNPKEWNHRKGDNAAYGLMQVLNKSVQLLKNPKELKDHFVDLDNDDMTDPNLSICAGTRWLFRKKQILESRTEGPVSWRDVVADYKSVKPDERKLMPRFDDYYRKLKEVKK
jgi:soluble lytic murein transglycosylase-like protein